MNPFGSPAPVPAPPPLPAPPMRSTFVTALAWCIISLSALACIVSAVALLMVLAGSHGTANTSVFGGLVVMGLPPVTLVAGIGLLCRWRWTYGYVLVLIGFIAAWNVGQMLRGPTPQHTYTSPGGVPTTVLASHVNYPVHILLVALSLGLFATLLTKSVRAEFRRPLQSPPVSASVVGISSFPAISPVAAKGEGAPGRRRLFPDLLGKVPLAQRARGWRVGHQGRDEMFYEEWRNGEWHRLRISGEMRMGRAHHVIYFDSPEAWLTYPEWAQHRRDEIVARIKSVFCAPDYEYHGDGTARSSSAVSVIKMPVIRSAGPAARRSGSFALLVAIAVLSGITGVMGWLVVDGLTSGKTYLPAKRASLSRSVVRVEEPVSYWMSIGVYAIVGTATLGLGARATGEAFRLRRQNLPAVRTR